MSTAAAAQPQPWPTTGVPYVLSYSPAERPPFLRSPVSWCLAALSAAIVCGIITLLLVDLIAQ